MKLPEKCLFTAVLNGAGDRNRTYDPLITKHKSNIAKFLFLKDFTGMYFYGVSVFAVSFIYYIVYIIDTF